ncbi:MAG: type III pantothenate kinase [Opitutaceae bacterium]|jgi:type III pantothenate kinase
MPLLCIDIGNTHTHYGVVGPDGVTDQDTVLTPLLDDTQEGLPNRLAALYLARPQIRGVAFCSVVPAINWRLREVLAASSRLPVFQLTHECNLGVPISYPKPSEIGQDRLANAAGVRSLITGPAVVIALGTAVAFDVITTRGGYEGGVITPGPALVTRYLHERTAQLPLVDDLQTPLKSVIGKSTAEAIRIGAVVGFAGLIQSILDAIITELAQKETTAPVIFLAGGAATTVTERLRQPVRHLPDLTLLGLAAAYKLNKA